MFNWVNLFFLSVTMRKIFSNAFSSLWHVTDQLYKILPYWSSHLLVQCIAGSFGGFTTTLITNPLDILRARLQVQRLGSIRVAFNELWAEEKMHMFFKGLSARLVQSAAFSFSIILGYETIKRISVKEQYKHLVKWWKHFLQCT